MSVTNLLEKIEGVFLAASIGKSFVTEVLALASTSLCSERISIDVVL